MKTFHKIIQETVAEALLFLLLLALLFVPRPAQAAWTFVQPVEFWLTNASPTLTNGPTGTTYSNQLTAFNLNLGVLTNNGSAIAPTVITVNSAPFPIVRDRGFLLNVGFWGTNAIANTNGLVGTVLQIATPYRLYTNTSGGYTMITNWGNQGALLITNFWNSTNTWGSTASTNEIFGGAAIPYTTIQNGTLGRLLSLINFGTNTVWFDPTNTFISILP